MRIADAKHIELLRITANLLADPRAAGRLEPLGDPEPIAFDPEGMQEEPGQEVAA